MPTYSHTTDHTRVIILNPEIRRAFWSTTRAWPGDAVKLFIETRNLKDGTEIQIQIWEEDVSEGGSDDYIGDVEGSHKLQNNRCTVDYVLNWNEDTFTREHELEGETMEFYFRVAVPALGLEARSNLLYVDLTPFLISA